MLVHLCFKIVLDGCIYNWKIEINTQQINFENKTTTEKDKLLSKIMAMYYAIVNFNTFVMKDGSNILNDNNGVL